MRTFFFFVFLCAVLFNLPSCGNMLPLYSLGENDYNLDIIGPVLQNATPTSIVVMWEDLISEGRVQFGLSPNQLEQTSEISVTPKPITQTYIHHATLSDLLPGATYYYQIDNGEREAKIYSFTTPPAKGSRQPFRFAVYSDCQQQPETHEKIVREGIEPYLDLGLGFVLVAGDIVQNGREYGEYRERFFAPMQSISPHVPYYVAIGNHEQNSEHYFDYLSLPTNGSPGFEEHWYAFDYGNTRILGLDTNKKYRTQTQLAWLEENVAAACEDSDLDFVFAFFHHPHKSELWLHGETNYSGEVIRILREKLAKCGKSGGYFFGHTHGYSRGQDKDHPLYAVNVGSAGGELDSWGEFAQKDYPEFQKSFDEYGVMMVEVNGEGQGKPSFNMQRLSFGDRETPKSAEVQDTFYWRPDNQPPSTPAVKDIQVTLKNGGLKLGVVASEFEDSDGDGFLEAEWQLLQVQEDGHEEVIATDWLRFENWYMDMDTNKGIELNQWKVNVEIFKRNVPTYVRVRYRDMGLMWSSWSEDYFFPEMHKQN